jgi:hypothetical protein
MSLRKGFIAGAGIVVLVVVLTPRAAERALAAAATAPQVWDFEADEPGQIARGFSAEAGIWEVARDGDNHVLYQKAKNGDDVFNLALVRGTSDKDVDLSVKLKAVAGELDRGGGLVWRARDKANYYICRYNPLEDNYRVYKVEKSKRTQFASAKVAGDLRRGRDDRPLVEGRRAVVLR